MSFHCFMQEFAASTFDTIIMIIIYKRVLNWSKVILKGFLLQSLVIGSYISSWHANPTGKIDKVSKPISGFLRVCLWVLPLDTAKP